MCNFFLTAISLVFLASSIGLIASSKKSRNTVLRRLYLHRSKAIGAFTPPRSVSPEKRGLPADGPAYPTYPDVFPPSRRHVLAELPDGAVRGACKIAKELAEQVPDFSKRLPSDVKADAPEMRDHVTATGFTGQEIKCLGDFPDYATLSGVPLPQPYQDFDITKAQPRPYRPLRWAYHQTMCRLKNIVIMNTETYDEAQPLPSWSRTGGWSSRIHTPIGSKSASISSKNTARWFYNNCPGPSLPRKS